MDPRDRFCRDQCGGKCCTLHVPGEGHVRCPRQNDDGMCSIYHERYAEGMADLVMVGKWESRKRTDAKGLPIVYGFWCGRVEQLIAAGQLDPEVEKGCCYAHPELLDEFLRKEQEQEKGKNEL